MGAVALRLRRCEHCPTKGTCCGSGHAVSGRPAAYLLNVHASAPDVQARQGGAAQQRATGRRGQSVPQGPVSRLCFILAEAVGTGRQRLTLAEAVSTSKLRLILAEAVGRPCRLRLNVPGAVGSSRLRIIVAEAVGHEQRGRFGDSDPGMRMLDPCTSMSSIQLAFPDKHRCRRARTHPDDFAWMGA